MSFDLYFAGDRQKHSDEYLLNNGGYRLNSQLKQSESKNIKEWCENMKDNNKLFVDSGAFTAHTKGTVVDIDAYIDYINRTSDKVTLYAQLDEIPGKFNQPKCSKDYEKSAEISWKNYLYMKDRVNCKHKILPVFHQGEDFKWLKNMLEYTDEDGHIPYIGLSPANDMPVSTKDEFLENCFDVIKKSSNPNVKTHAFGMTSLYILEKYPLTSADSTSWKLTAAMGSILTPWGTVRVSNRDIYDKDFIKNKNEEIYEKLNEYVESMGFTFEDISTKDYCRYVLNIKFLQNWAKNYTYKPAKFKKERLF